VAPLMMMSVAVAGVFFQEGVARERVLQEIRSVIGQPAANAVASIESPVNRPEGTLATAVGGITLLFGALGVFRHLHDALNSIWRTMPPKLGFWAGLWRQVFSLAVVLATGFLLLVSLVLSAGLSWLAGRALQRLEVPLVYFRAINLVLSFGVITLLFALIFRLLPDRHVPWRHVWLGAVVTAVLFSIGKSALGIYLAHAKVGSAYGAAGSVIALLLWCYYAAQIVFLGAEFTRITTLSDGGRDFRPLDHPLERVRLSRPEPGDRFNARIGTRRRRRPAGPGKGRG